LGVGETQGVFGGEEIDWGKIPLIGGVGREGFFYNYLCWTFLKERVIKEES